MSVYVITDRAAGLCKIGYSQTPLRRLSTLRCASASDLRLEGVIPAARQGERDLHRRFRHLRRAREWFALDVEVEALIAAFPNGKAPRADRLRSPANVHPSAASVQADIAAFCAANDMAPTRFGLLALNDKAFVAQLGNGRRVWPETEAKVRRFMATYRPSEARAA